MKGPLQYLRTLYFMTYFRRPSHRSVWSVTIPNLTPIKRDHLLAADHTSRS